MPKTAAATLHYHLHNQEDHLLHEVLISFVCCLCTRYFSAYFKSLVNVVKVIALAAGQQTA